MTLLFMTPFQSSSYFVAGSAANALEFHVSLIRILLYALILSQLHC